MAAQCGRWAAGDGRLAASEFARKRARRQHTRAGEAARRGERAGAERSSGKRLLLHAWSGSLRAGNPRPGACERPGSRPGAAGSAAAGALATVAARLAVARAVPYGPGRAGADVADLRTGAVNGRFASAQCL